VDIPAPPVPTAAWTRDAAVDVETNDVRDRRLFLILVDDASFGDATLRPSTREKIKETARTVIRHLGPTDLAAVVFTGDNRRSQDFTADHGRLLAAVNQMTGVSLPSLPAVRAPGVVSSGAGNFLSEKPAAAAENFLSDIYSVTVLERAVESLLRAPGRRKALVDITSFSMTWGTSFLTARTEAMFDKAQRAGVNVYTMGPKPVIDRAYWEGSWFRRVAHETGGEWFGEILKPGAAEQAVTSIFQANSSYYILGYSSADLKKFHFIKVVVDVPGVEVRTREKYYWPDPAKPDTGPPPPPLVKAIAEVLPNAGVSMQTVAMAFVSAASDGATIAVVTNLHLTPPSNAVSSGLETFDVATHLFTAQGDPRGAAVTQSSVRHNGREIEREVLSSVAAPKPGLYEVRVAAHREAASLDGSVYATVDVPDFAKLPVSFSSVVVSTADWPRLGQKDALASLLPAMPTTERAFGARDRAGAFVRVYQGGKGRLASVPVHIRIVDDHDRVVVDRTETCPPARFNAARSTDVRVDLPTSTLAPGPYLLIFETTLGKATARREVRFSVR
jgi:VWFA-related protein